MIARRILAALAPALIYMRATPPRPPLPGLDEPTREYEAVDLDDLGPRLSRQITGQTGAERWAQRAADDRARAHSIRRLEMELIGDADFRRLAASLLDEIADND